MHTLVDGWGVYVGDDPDDADATAGPDISEDDVDAAQRWATDMIATDGVTVTGWQPAPGPYGEDGWQAQIAATPSR